MRTDKMNLKLKQIMGRNAKIIVTRLLFPFRNQFILFNISNRAKANHVNLNYWDESENLGDVLSPIIVCYMLSLKGIDQNIIVNGRRHLYAVGSVLTAGIQDATVWGSGVLNASLTYRLEKRKLDVRAVRGPLTRAILMDYGYQVPEVYGDPALLMPEIYTPNKLEKKCKYGLVVHKDYDTSNIYYSGNEIKELVKTINICTTDYKTFIDEINSVQIIISSSLHGIILAEAYGIPAILLKPQKDYVKYLDYYYCTGRVHFPVAETVEEAISIIPSNVPDLSSITELLKKSFPYDLYE